MSKTISRSKRTPKRNPGRPLPIEQEHIEQAQAAPQAAPQEPDMLLLVEHRVTITQRTTAERFCRCGKAPDGIASRYEYCGLTIWRIWGYLDLDYRVEKWEEPQIEFQESDTAEGDVEVFCQACCDRAEEAKQNEMSLWYSWNSDEPEIVSGPLSIRAVPLQQIGRRRTYGTVHPQSLLPIGLQCA